MGLNLKSRKLNRLAPKILYSKFRNSKALSRVQVLRIIRILSKTINKIYKTIKKRMNKKNISNQKKSNKFKKMYNYLKIQFKIKDRKRTKRKRKKMMMTMSQWI